MELVSRHEKALFITMLFISGFIWLPLIVVTRGIALLYFVFFYVFFLFTHSALIAYLKGNSVKITQDVFPDLFERVQDCVEKLGIKKAPEAYVLQAEGGFNAFATRFAGKHFVVLFSDVVDALEEKPEALNFYIGHELGHIDRGHLLWTPVIAPASFLPLIGAAHSRAREKTADNYGLYCCKNVDDAVAGLAALAAGPKRWKQLPVNNYMEQIKETGSFWMSFNELISGYPWTVKRMARILSRSGGAGVDLPSRSPMAWVFAMFVPNTPFTGGSPGALLVFAAIVGMLATIAVPSFFSYKKAGCEDIAKMDARKAYSASLVYFSANSVDSDFTLEDLSEFGFVQTPGVDVRVLDGSYGQLRISASHEKGKAAYVIDRAGDLEKVETGASRY